MENFVLENKSKKEVIVLYDSECGFCNKIALYLKEKDTDNTIVWEERNSELSSQLFKNHSINKEEDSIIVVINKDYLIKSDAVIYILKLLKFRTYYLLKIIPKKIRDIVYDSIAKNRYLFGKCNLKNENLIK